MMTIGQSKHRTVSGLFFSTLFVLSALAGCSDKKKSESSPEADGGPGSDAAIVKLPDDCNTKDCAANAPAIAWASKDPKFYAQLRVVDGLGRPLKDATVVVGDKSQKTDDKGRASVGPIKAVERTRVRVDKAGQTPFVTHTSAWKSGKSAQQVGMVPVGEQKDFDGDKPLKMSTGGASADVKGRSLSSKDGTRVKAGKAEATYFKPDKGRPAALPGSQAGVSRSGAPTALADLQGVLYLHFTDMAGQALNLAPGQSARVNMPVGNKSRAKAGDSIPLWSLDEKSAEWKQESSCVVEKRKVGDNVELVCNGSVPHFSYWALADELKLDEKGSLGCLNAVTSVAKDACFTASIQSQILYGCDAQGENCTPSALPREVFLPNGTDKPDWCGLVNGTNMGSADSSAVTYRMQLVYDVDAEGCKDQANPPASGRRTILTDVIPLGAFDNLVGSDLMRDFTEDSASVCSKVCQEVPFEIKAGDLDAPIWVDQDDDGFFQASNGAKELAPGVPSDCDDGNSVVYPGAPEPVCVTEDRNCDGAANKTIPSYADVADESAWNTACQLCGTELAKAGAKEVPGNLYDENCDGKAEDRDGDGVSEPADCDDYDSTTSPKAKEVAGNFADEDCDGLALDADGDGAYAIEHIDAASRLGLELADFKDCDDVDPNTNPGVTPATEAGALAGYFAKQSDGIHRSADFCKLFDAKGAPTPLYHLVVKDLNCDGATSDVDGDGYAAVGDFSLGENLAIDCNDFDPRVAPANAQDRSCKAPSGLINDSECKPKLPTGDPSCPALTLSGTVLVPICQETTSPVDGSPTGEGACTFPGWSGGNPLSVEPGTLWGPCDGGTGAGPLADCPGNSSCNGVLNYTASFTKYLEDTYLDGATLGYKGMCFPVCAIP